MTPGPRIQALTGGRLHLHHGPIDIVLRAWGPEVAVGRAYRSAADRFATILAELVAELPSLRRPAAERPILHGPTARRMVAAVAPFKEFVTPMAAVAGAVADEVLAAMLAAAPLDRAFVNDGGDIAVHLAPGERMAIGLAQEATDGSPPPLGGALTLRAEDGIGGVATSGAGGRSLSLGIADSVTVLAGTAAAADAAATLIANAVDVPSPAIARRPATDLDPDSDLGERLVTVNVGSLRPDEVASALAAGMAKAEEYRRRGVIRAAAMSLRGETRTVGARDIQLGISHPSDDQGGTS